MEGTMSEFMQEAGQIALENVLSGKGGPFGAVIVKDGKIIARGMNLVTVTPDPTAHAEVTAIREAAKALGTFDLSGCEIYTSCEPCPMCLGAIYWARLEKVYYAATQADAAAIDFDDEFIYQEFARPIEDRRLPMIQEAREEGLKAFKAWKDSQNKIRY